MLISTCTTLETPGADDPGRLLILPRWSSQPDHTVCFRTDPWPDDLALRVLGVGSIENAHPGRISTFTPPSAFVAFAQEGVLELRQGGRVWEAAGRRALFARPCDQVALAHHPHPGGGPTDIVFAHITATLHTGIDVWDLVDRDGLVAPDASLRVVAAIARALELDRGANELGQRAGMKAVGFEILTALLADATMRPGAGRRLAAAQPLEPVLRAVNERLAEPFDLVSLARIAAVSPASLHRRFMEAFGVPPMTHIRGIRLDEAARRLLHTDRTVAEVANSVGFADADHFSAIFRSRFGATPSAYRADRVLAPDRHARRG